MVETDKGETIEREPLNEHTMNCWSDLLSPSPTLMHC